VDIHEYLFGPVRLAETWLKTLFWLNCCEGKTLFRLKKEAEQAGFWVSRTNWSEKEAKLTTANRQSNEKRSAIPNDDSERK